MVGFRKVMDFFPRVFSQHDLFWLDNVTPSFKSSQAEKNNDEDKQNEQQVLLKVINNTLLLISILIFRVRMGIWFLSKSPNSQKMMAVKVESSNP